MNFQYSNIFVAQKLSEWENFKDWHILQLDTHFRLIFPPSIVLRVDNIFFTAVTEYHYHLNSKYYQNFAFMFIPAYIGPPERHRYGTISSYAV